MRTTLTLDPDVLSLVTDEMHRRRCSMKQVVNDAIRRGLARAPVAAEAEAAYRVTLHEATLAPGVDPAGFNRLADALEDDAALDLARAPR